MNIPSTFKKTLIGAALLAATTAAQAASYNISNSLAGLLANVQAMGPTTFGTGTFQCANPGVNCTDPAVNGLPGVSYSVSGSGSVSLDAGALLNNLPAGSNNYLEWTFATPQNGWGGTFRMTTGNGLEFQALDLAEGNENLGWVDVTSVDLNQALDGFLGFSSTERFGAVRVRQFSNPTGSSYRMENVSIAKAEVPEPGSLALLALGAMAVGFARRQRKS